jgi:integrase
MAAKLVKTRHPGIYKRGSRYVATYRVNGRQHRESAPTLEAARKLKATRETDSHRGEFHEQSRLAFHKYAIEWVERYQGRGRRGFRENTRAEYRRDLEHYALTFCGPRERMTDITPRRVAEFVAWCCKQPTPGGKPLSDASVRRILSPVRSCFARAVQEGVVRHNPTAGVALPARAAIVEDDDHAKALTREQLDMFIRVVDPGFRLFFLVLATTGLRWSEAVALRWRDVTLTGEAKVRVRRALVGTEYGPPKSRHGRREIPLARDVVDGLRALHGHTEWNGHDDLVFPTRTGTPLDYSNTRRRVLEPAAEEAGVSWAGFHTFRHTCASLLFEHGANAVRVQRWLGHHSPAFTLATYVHLLDGDLGMPLDLALGGNRVSTGLTDPARDELQTVPQTLAA